MKWTAPGVKPLRRKTTALNIFALRYSIFELHRQAARGFHYHRAGRGPKRRHYGMLM
jgi:hypothetical protein